jgi:hypothetical protein
VTTRPASLADLAESQFDFPQLGGVPGAVVALEVQREPRSDVTPRIYGLPVVIGKSMITVVFEAHSTSVDNEARLASGHYDAALSRLGERQANELGVRYRIEKIDAVFCSDLQRSYRTAQIAFAGCAIPIIKDVRLRDSARGPLPLVARRFCSQSAPA